MSSTQVGGEEVRRKRILLVDDDAMGARLTGMLLQNAGYTVEAVADGALGLSKFPGSQWDLVLTDNRMRRMGGEEMAAAMKAIDARVPIIMITGLLNDLQHPEWFAQVLPKPYGTKDLLACVRRVLSESASNKGSPTSTEGIPRPLS